MVVVRELSTGRLTVLLGWLLRVRSEFEELPDEFLVVMLLPILDVMLELMRPLELSTGRLTVLRFDELEFDEFGRVVSCRPSVLELGAVGVLTDDELEEGRRMIEELVGREVVGRVTVDREVVGRVIVDREVVGRVIVDREVMDREVAGLDIVDREVVDREVVGRLDVTLLEDRLEVLRLDVTLLVLRLDVAVLELLDVVDLEVVFAAGADFAAGWLFRLVLLDRLVAAITGSLTSARISKKRTKNKGRKAKDSFPASKFCLSRMGRLTVLSSDFRLLISEFCFLINILRLLSSAFTS